MSRFRQMVVIPQEEYVQLKSSQNTKQPLSQLYQDTLKEYNENANIIDPYKRLITQSENLEELKLLKAFINAEEGSAIRNVQFLIILISDLCLVLVL